MGCFGRRPRGSARAPRAARPSSCRGPRSCASASATSSSSSPPRRSSRRKRRWPSCFPAWRWRWPGCAGTIGLTLASRAREVAGVEIVEPAVADAIENARLNEITNASFYAGDIRLEMRLLVEQAGRPDVAVIDPPRAGLSQKVVRRIVEAAPKRIVYVSCNPTTLAPNAAQLVEAGYELKRVRPVDLFPQTPHIECVALLEAGPTR